MSESEWTGIVKRQLRHKGELLGYDKQTGFEERLTFRNKLKIEPDVLWVKNNHIYSIFEIDMHSSKYYQKTIFGSMFSGVLLTKAKAVKGTFRDFTIDKNTKFVEVVLKGVENSKKARQGADLFRKYFGKNIYVIEIPMRTGTYKKANMQYILTTELKRNRVI